MVVVISVEWNGTWKRGGCGVGGVVWDGSGGEPKGDMKSGYGVCVGVCGWGVEVRAGSDVAFSVEVRVAVG